MTNYVCDRCGFETKLRPNFVRHLYRKNMCLPNLRNISILEVVQKYSIEMNNIVPISSMTTNEPMMNTNEPISNLNEPMNEPVMSQSTNNNLSDDLKCQYCENMFSTIPNKRRHELHRCKKKNIEKLDKTLPTNKII